MLRIRVKKERLIFGLIGLAAAAMAAGCGKNGSPIASMVNNVEVKTFQQGSDDWVSVSATLITGGYQLAGINIPVINPDTQVQYANVSLITNICSGTGACQGGGTLNIAVNLTASTQLPPGAPFLPNGTMLPVGGLQQAKVVTLPIPNSSAKIYLAFGPGVAMVGTAIPFSALDPAGHYLPGINIFEPLHFGPINAIAGIFAGAAPMTTGVGLFVDLSSVVNPVVAPSGQTTLVPLASIAAVENQQGASGAPAAVKNRLTLNPVMPSKKVQDKLYRKLYELSKKGLELKIE